MERRTRDLLLADFKRARDGDYETLMALVDAWTAYVERIETENERLRAEAAELDYENTDTFADKLAREQEGHAETKLEVDRLRAERDDAVTRLSAYVDILGEEQGGGE